jgi:plasmid maintenance system killer protein
VIEFFRNALPEDLFDDKNSKATKAFPPELCRIARRKLQYVHEAVDLSDLKSPPGNRMEGLERPPEGASFDTDQRSMAKQPKNPFHPGKILLEEFLDPSGMSQAALAEKIGWTKARLNYVHRRARCRRR